MTAAVARLRDRPGLPVDPGIRDTVAALNLSGLPTRQSCEGHVSERGHGHPAPWIDLVLDPAVLARAQDLLDTFSARIEPVEDDLRLVLNGERLGNGGGFAALEATRLRLGRGGFSPGEVEALRRRLGARQAEMRRFTAFLRRRHLSGEGAASALDDDHQMVISWQVNLDPQTRTR